MTIEEFKEGDTVVAIGFTFSKKGVKETHYTMGKVEAIGKYDLYLLEKTSHGTDFFKMPKKNCIKLDLKNVNFSKVEIAIPKIGDLVLSISSTFGKIEKKKGMISEIIEKPGRRKMARITRGPNSDLVFFNSLIVLEH